MGRVTGGASFRVDPSLFDGRYSTPRSVYGELERVVRADLQYHYSTPICAQRWLDVCDDPAYGHDALLRRITEVFPGLVDALVADRGGVAGIAVTSLGPGDGSIDQRVLQAIDRSVGVHSYRALDFSFELLRRAVHRIAHTGDFRQPFPIDAVCGDFTDVEGLREVIADSDAARLFLLTGLTLGNYAEDRLLRQVSEGLMSPGDYLLVDGRSHGLDPGRPASSFTFEERGDLTRSYDLETVRRFVLGPLEVATEAGGHEIEIGYDIDRGLTTVPGAWNIVIHARDLETTMRLTGTPVRRDRLDLAVTTLYHTSSLGSWFPSQGFEVVWEDSRDGTSFFLLRCR
jgi:hypothetical protein